MSYSERASEYDAFRRCPCMQCAHPAGEWERYVVRDRGDVYAVVYLHNAIPFADDPPNGEED